MQTRTEILSKLLAYQTSMDELTLLLQQFPWDSREELVVLTPDHIRHMINRYLSGELNEQQFEDWANAIEGREDIGFLPGYEDTLADAIHQLANPLLTQPITSSSAQGLLKVL